MMTWIVVGEDKGKIKLVSKNNVDGLLPKGSYLTIESGQTKFILRVDDSRQEFPYSPTSMIVDMDLTPLEQDQKCQNVIYAYRVKDLSNRNDGLIDFIKPQLTARRSNQDEINYAMGYKEMGPKVFIATIYASQNHILKDDNGKLINATLPESMFFHQMLICGKTGSGKTVSTKYLAQYFVEKFEGAVLAINVKDVDFLRMDRPSTTTNEDTLNEWNSIDEKPHGITNFHIYYPANTCIKTDQGINTTLCTPITLNVREIEPESLSALLRGVSGIGAQHLPDIFRYWQREHAPKQDPDEFTFSNFVRYFENGIDNRLYTIMNSRGDIIFDVPLHKGTLENIHRNLVNAEIFFDNTNAEYINENDILVNGKMSVIDVAQMNSIQFGSILIRHLLKKIVEKNSNNQDKVPILIIIDEVHKFYNTDSQEALDDLDTICRTGRSQKIGVIFSSQNPEDIPYGLSSVINTKIFFKSDTTQVKKFGINISSDEMENLMKGYAVASIHELSQLKTLKFPMSFSGVFDN